MSDHDPPLRPFTPALPMTTIASNLARESYSERDIRSIIHDTEFAVIQSRSHQICFLTRYARETLRHEASVSE
jgi:hypothetical protein